MNDREFVDRLIEVVAREAGVKRVDLLRRTGSGREHYVCKYRDDAIYLARERTKASSVSWETLGVWFGARNHSTLIIAHRRVAQRLLHNPPRRDNRTWADWHKYILDSVEA